MLKSSMRVSKGGVVTRYGSTTKAEASFCAGGMPSAAAKAIWPSLELVGIGVAVGRGVEVSRGVRVTVTVRVCVGVRVSVRVRVGGRGVHVGLPTRVLVAVRDGVRVRVGGVCGGANLHPRLYVELYEAAVSGDLNLVHRLQHRVLRLSARLYSVGDPPSGYLTGLKCAMSCLGLCSDRLAEPLHALSDDRRATIARHLKDLGLTGSAVARPQFNVAHPTPE